MHPNKKVSKTVITADGIILHIDNPKDFTKKVLELVDELAR